MIRNFLHFFFGFLLYWSVKWGFEGLDLYFESQNTGGKELGALGEAFIAYFLFFLSFITLSIPLIYFIKNFERKEFPKRRALLSCFLGYILTFTVIKLSDEWQIHKEVSTHVENSKKASDYVKKEFPNYKQIHQSLKDTINTWIGSGYGMVEELIKSNPNFVVDSLIIFNKSQNKLKASIIFSFYRENDKNYSGYKNIYGFKQDNIWLFIPDFGSYAYLTPGFYDLNLIDYPLKKLQIMNHIYNVKGNVYPEQIEFFNDINQPYLGDKFNGLSLECQVFFVDSLLNYYKSIEPQDHFYDETDDYNLDQESISSNKRAIRVNKMVFKQLGY